MNKPTSLPSAPQPSTGETGGPADESDSSRQILVALDTTFEQPGVTTFLHDRMRRVCDELALSRVELNVVLVDDGRIAELHRRFLGVEGTTDVITFDLSDAGPGGGAVEGELYLCVDEARRRSAELGHPIEHELLLYAVHGLLHLLGHDDHDEDEARRMHAREDELLGRIGIGPVYGRSAAPDRKERR